jgi:hypothetical protein
MLPLADVLGYARLAEPIRLAAMRVSWTAESFIDACN